MIEVGIVPLFLSDSEEVNDPVLFVDLRNLRDISVTRRDAILQPAGSRIVQVEVSPVLSLRKPDDFVRGREVPPVRTIIAALVIRFVGFLKNIANLARC